MVAGLTVKLAAEPDTITVSAGSNWSLSVEAVRLNEAVPEDMPAAMVIIPGAVAVKSAACAVPGETVSGISSWRWAVTPLGKEAVTLTE